MKHPFTTTWTYMSFLQTRGYKVVPKFIKLKTIKTRK